MNAWWRWHPAVVLGWAVCLAAVSAPSAWWVLGGLAAAACLALSLSRAVPRYAARAWAAACLVVLAAGSGGPHALWLLSGVALLAEPPDPDVDAVDGVTCFAIYALCVAVVWAVPPPPAAWALPSLARLPLWSGATVGAALSLLWCAAFAERQGRDSFTRLRAQHDSAFERLGDHVANERQVRAATQAAVSADMARLASTSHELRTPLVGVLGMTEVLRAEARHGGEVDAWLDTMDATAQRLLVVLNAVLDVAKVTSGKMSVHLTPTLVSAWWPKALHGVRMEQEAILPQHRALLLDRDLLEQTLATALRLLEQLAPGGKTAAQLRTVPDEDGRAVLEVRLHRQAPSRFSADLAQAEEVLAHGLGAGLPSRELGGVELLLVAELLRCVGGRADLSSGDGREISLGLRVPAAAVDPAMVASEPGELSDDQTTVHARPLRILVADDNLINRMVFSRVLRTMGHQVLVVEDGAQAVAAFSRGGDDAALAFDVLLLDLEMPVLDGLGATRAIRSSAAGRRVPIFALTAHSAGEVGAVCAAAGMDGVLSKPLRPERLSAALSAAA